MTGGTGRWLCCKLLPLPRLVTADTHRVLESLKLEKAFKIIGSNDKFKMAKSTTKPKQHIYTNTSSASSTQDLSVTEERTCSILICMSLILWRRNCDSYPTWRYHKGDICSKLPKGLLQTNLKSWNSLQGTLFCCTKDNYAALFGEEGRKFCCPCYSLLLRDELNRDITGIKTWKDSSNWDTDRSRQQSEGVTERQKVSQRSRDLGEFPLGVGGCYNLKWGDAAISWNLFWYSDQDSSISRSVMVQGKELLRQWGWNVMSWARMEIGEIICVMISLLIQKSLLVLENLMVKVIGLLVKTW